MNFVLEVKLMVITGDNLAGKYQGERELLVENAAVLTPTAWDFVRDHRMRVTRGKTAMSSFPSAAALPANKVEVGSQMVAHGQCDHPGISCGCDTDEFGSGFVQPENCTSCVIHQLKVAGQPNPGCKGCNLNGYRDPVEDDGVDLLVTRITEEILEQLC